jgi:hypothetical protein
MVAIQQKTADERLASRAARITRAFGAFGACRITAIKKHGLNSFNQSIFIVAIIDFL